MSAEHNHPRRCCRHPQGQVKLSTDRCPACPKHGVCICDLARSEPLDHKAGSHHEADEGCTGEGRGRGHTYTAAEVKVLTETAGEAGRRIGRAEAADKLAATFGRRAQIAERVPEGERSGVREGMVVTWIAAQRLAEDMASLPFTAAPDATSGVPGHQEVSEAVRSPQEPCGHPTCPCAEGTTHD